MYFQLEANITILLKCILRARILSTYFPIETNVWLEGKNAYCSYIQRECFDFVPLSFLGVPDKLNKNQLEAAKSLRTNYCNAGIRGTAMKYASGSAG